MWFGSGYKMTFLSLKHTNDLFFQLNESEGYKLTGSQNARHKLPTDNWKTELWVCSLAISTFTLAIYLFFKQFSFNIMMSFLPFIVLCCLELWFSSFQHIIRLKFNSFSATPIFYLVSMSRVLKHWLNGSGVCFLLFTNTKHIHIYNISSLHRNLPCYNMQVIAPSVQRN